MASNSPIRTKNTSAILELDSSRQQPPIMCCIKKISASTSAWMKPALVWASYTQLEPTSQHIAKKGSLVADSQRLEGTKSENSIWVLCKLPHSKHLQVNEITIYLSSTMKFIAKQALPNATIIADRFHVQKLMNEAISDRRLIITGQRSTKRITKWRSQKRWVTSLSHTFLGANTLVISHLRTQNILS